MKTYFISGVCGVGKSTLIPHLRELLPVEKYLVVDFDSRGVPDGADHAWRKSEASYWLSEGKKMTELGKELIVCGFVKETDFPENELGFEVIVLDADKDTILERLMKRYTKNGVFDESQKVIGKPVMEFIGGNVWYSNKMREESLTAGHPIVDTSNKLPKDVASEVVALILKK